MEQILDNFICSLLGILIGGLGIRVIDINRQKKRCRVDNGKKIRRS